MLPLARCDKDVGDVFNNPDLIEILSCTQVNTLDGYGRAPIHYAAERNEECLDLHLFLKWTENPHIYY